VEAFHFRVYLRWAMGKKRECGMRKWQRVKSGKENAGEKYGTTGNKWEYKMRDLIATTARW